MGQLEKRSVIERLRVADRWLEVNGGVPMAWVRDLLKDAANQLEGESGALWLQTITGLGGHARLFVQGPFTLRELDLLLEILHLTRTWMAKDVGEPSAAVEAVAETEGERT